MEEIPDSLLLLFSSTSDPSSTDSSTSWPYTMSSENLARLLLSLEFENFQ